MSKLLHVSFKHVNKNHILQNDTCILQIINENTVETGRLGENKFINYIYCAILKLGMLL